MLGLPGNPVSSIVCGHIFMRPLLRAMQGLAAAPLPVQTAVLAAPLPPNGPRQHYMRARVENGEITAAERQDSALLTVLAEANALLIRAPNEDEKPAGARVKFIEL